MKKLEIFIHETILDFHSGAEPPTTWLARAIFISMDQHESNTQGRKQVHILYTNPCNIYVDSVRQWSPTASLRAKWFCRRTSPPVFHVHEQLPLSVMCKSLLYVIFVAGLQVEFSRSSFMLCIFSCRPLQMLPWTRSISYIQSVEVKRFFIEDTLLQSSWTNPFGCRRVSLNLLGHHCHLPLKTHQCQWQHQSYLPLQWHQHHCLPHHRRHDLMMSLFIPKHSLCHIGRMITCATATVWGRYQ